MIIPLLFLLNLGQLNLGYAYEDPITGQVHDLRTSCIAWLTVLYLSAPTFIIYFFVRCAHVVIVCKAHLAKYFISTRSNRHESLVWTYSRVDELIRVLNRVVTSFLSPSPKATDHFDTYSVHSNASHVSFKHIKGKLLEYAKAQQQISFFGVFKAYLVVCLLELLLLIITISLDYGNLGTVQPCPITNYLGVMAMAFMGLCVVPWFIINIQHVNEHFWIKREMQLVCAEIILFMLLYLINLTVQKTDAGEAFGRYLGSDIWMILMLIALLTTCLLVPGIMGSIELSASRSIVKEVKKSENEYNEMQKEFTHTLETPQLFEKFKAYLVADFAIENGLFYEQYQKYTRKYNILQGGYTDNDRQDLLNQLKTIYNDFIGSNATHELNLPMDMRDGLKEALEQDRFELALLTPIAREVAKMLMDNNFPRFYRDVIVA